MRNLKLMTQKQKIESQYLKLIGVTLMMTAACVTDASNKRSYSFADESVREIILEQFQLFSSSHLGEVIEWESALKNATENHSDGNFDVRYVHLKLLVEQKAFKKLLNDLGADVQRFDVDLSRFCVDDQPDEAQTFHLIQNRNKNSLVTRAGPLA
ncbi:hypothetical protein [Carboxylicivirga sp. M1479]|uniref:hypothetical protein n=2 Tax=Carboxylicivirga TaxID=1628153 RepID=UPI0011779501|nr:hypothetical protein [Carboxylicivirga sp. M1479]TRX70409.1 hypothetical protein FNN09_11840 [Carboxylicivirga sp. M1479]